MSLLPSLLVLGPAAAAALWFTLNRLSPPQAEAERRAAARALALATAVQGAHFVEEAVTGFHEILGPFFGLEGMPLAGFVAFNLVWIGIWVVSVPGLRSAHRGALFAASFLAIAGMLNGILHPLLALAAGGYFPGLLTSPAVGLASLLLWLRLRSATVSPAD